MKKILLIDDDKNQLIYLEKMLCNDFHIVSVENTIKANQALLDNKFDVMIVDVHMPIVNGINYIQELRERRIQLPPIFILSSDTSSKNKIQALNIGIKDFLWPEMNKDEMIARIKNHLIIDSIENKITFKNISICTDSLLATVNSEKVDLTLIEFKILTVLLNLHERTISREEIKNFTWPGIYVLDKTLNTHLTNLRSKLIKSNVQIKSIKGEGIQIS